jgi:hypothetical protein
MQEINEVDHLDIAKHEFVLNKLINQLTKYMATEFSVAYNDNTHGGKTVVMDVEEEAMAITEMLLTTMPVQSEEERESFDTIYTEQDAEQEEQVKISPDDKQKSNGGKSNAASRQNMSLRDAANDYFRVKMLRLAEIVNERARGFWLTLRNMCVAYIR